MRDTAWKWIAIVAIAIILGNLVWQGMQVLEWKREVDVRLGDLEQAFLAAHPEFRQPTPSPRPTPNQEQ